MNMQQLKYDQNALGIVTMLYVQNQEPTKNSVQKITFCQDRPAPNTEKQRQETEKQWLFCNKYENNVRVHKN